MGMSLWSAPAMRALSAEARDWLRDRQPQPQQGAAALRGVHADAAAVALRHLADDGQAQPGARAPARLVGPEEAVEHPGAVLGRDSRPVVAHAQLPAGEPYVDRRARRAVLRGV